MSKASKFWLSDGFTGIAYSIAFLVIATLLAKSTFTEFETAAYDRQMSALNVAPSSRVAVIDIDDKSIEELGRWPWSRDLYQHLNDQLVAGGAKVIAYGLLFSESQVDPGRVYLKEIKQELDALLSDPALSQSPELGTQAETLANTLASGISTLNYDARLADSFRVASNVIIPVTFELGDAVGNADAPLGEALERNIIIGGPENAGLPATRMISPIDALADAAFRVGHLNQLSDDHDGVLRKESLVVNYFGKRFPSLSLTTAAAALNLDSSEINLSEQALDLGQRKVSTNAYHQFLPAFYSTNNGQQPFTVDSFTDVFTAKVPADKYRDKIVLIGASAVGVGNRFATPIDPDMSPVMVLAHNVSSLIQGDYIERPAWAGTAETGLFVLIALYITLLLPRLRARTGLIASLSLVGMIMLVGIGGFLTTFQWFKWVTPLLFLIGGHLVVTVKQFGVTERLRASSDEASSESNRMLGLAFQGQGQLDIAFEKFRQCPLDDAILEPLYNLALDFERKRQFNKAGAVYGYMAEYNANYRDLDERLKRNRALDKTMILGQSSGGGPTQFVLDDDGGLQKPMLGRYSIEKELGRGAMGTVYLGRDPKINRVVAIKTIALSEEFDEEDLAVARDRFFREAETAGRLNHPDIVTVFDAGEEHDLAYIAMEFLKGEELSRHTDPSNLLPVNTALKIVARVAEALSYAHQMDVVHRDIKPANIMYNMESDSLKITDFGIARITNSSKTKTGIVLGTPSYMSPEQLAGQSVTGKSDLFSLAVTMFQLLTGQLPFRADSMATLMFKIANEEHTPLHSVRPELPGQLARVIDTALSKDPADRYNSGLEMAHELRECLQHLAA